MGFFSKIAKKVKKQIKRTTRQVKAEVKRAPANIVKYGPALLSATGIGGVLGSALGAVGGVLGGAGGGTLQVDPYYPPTGGTPIGQGSLGRPAPGQAIGGRPTATASVFERYPQFPGSTRVGKVDQWFPLASLALGGVLLVTLFRR